MRTGGGVVGTTLVGAGVPGAWLVGAGFVGAGLVGCWLVGDCWLVAGWPAGDDVPGA